MIIMLYPTGVNSAVMLMNLTKMREFKWTEYMGPILNKFELNLTWGDQDIINIIFHYHPGTYIRCSVIISFYPFISLSDCTTWLLWGQRASLIKFSFRINLVYILKYPRT